MAQPVNFNAAGNLTLTAASTLVAEITRLRHSFAAEIGRYRGSRRHVETHVHRRHSAPGNSWNIIDASAITGGFTTLDLSAAPALAAGQAYQVYQVNGGTNGKLLKLSVDEILVLQVHRTTGAVSIANIGTSRRLLKVIRFSPRVEL